MRRLKSSMARPALGWLPAVLAASVLISCGSTAESGTAADPPETSQSASESPTADAANQWIAQTDASSGVRFLLPERVEPETRAQPFPDGSTGRTRMYQLPVEGSQLAVAITTTQSDLSGYDPLRVYRGLVAGLSRAGADDAGLSRVHDVQGAGQRALDATLTFTSKKGSQNYWRLRTIVTGDAVVQVQALTFADRGDLPAASREVDRLFGRLVDGIEPRG